MSRIWAMMDTGKRAMMNSQTALQTVSHNIASKNVEGYSRQRVELQTNEPTGEGNLRIGNGAKAVKIVRINNPFIEKQLEQEGNVLGEKKARSGLMARVEQVFNEQTDKGLNKYMGDFFNAYREMSNSPENLALRDQVKQSGQFLAQDFQRVSGQLRKIQDESDFEIHNIVTQVNDMTREIASLNQKIASVEINGVTANDERDRRDLLVKDLAQKLDIRYAESKNGELTVTTAGNAVLVSGSEQRDLAVAPSPSRKGKGEGNVDIFYKDTAHGTPMCITDHIKGGYLGGLLSVRDKYIGQTLGKVDELAYSMATEINKIHKAGFDRMSRQGLDFFTVGDKEGAAGRIAVNSAILRDPGRIVAAAEPNAPGDNRIANVISSLQYQTRMDHGQSTFGGFYNNIVGDVGITASRANSELASQKDIVDQIKNIRESISGVSLDEETAKMIEYQKTFEASARLIKTADEMMNTVMNLKPM